MNISKDRNANDFLSGLALISSERLEAVESIRKLFHTQKTKPEEDIKYGGLVFMVSGNLVGGIYSYEKHISIEFTNGVEFEDKFGVLEGKGKHRRHIKIHEFSDVESKHVEFYIQQALKKR